MTAHDLFDWAAWYAQLCFVLSMTFAVVRLVRGPSAQDRVLALDAFYINGMLILLMLGIRSTSTVMRWRRHTVALRRIGPG